MFRRLMRFVLASAALAGAAFAVSKAFRSRKSGGAGMPSGDESIMPKRSEAPLVTPSLMDGLDVRKAGADGTVNERANGHQSMEPAPGPVAAVPAGDVTWVEPAPDGTCPEGYPVKAKLASGIFHAPGMLAYDRTTPDRCYPDEASAEADGLRKAKR